MNTHETQALQAELEQFKKEKETIRQLVGQIGGAGSRRRDLIVNIIFVVLMVALLVFDVMRHFLHIDVPLPPLFSLQMGVLLVSVKIIWMIHMQVKVGHFQFWILNSIEYRINDVSNRLKKLEGYVRPARDENEAS